MHLKRLIPWGLGGVQAEVCRHLQLSVQLSCDEFETIAELTNLTRRLIIISTRDLFTPNLNQILKNTKLKLDPCAVIKLELRNSSKIFIYLFIFKVMVLHASCQVGWHLPLICWHIRSARFRSHSGRSVRTKGCPAASYPQPFFFFFFKLCVTTVVLFYACAGSAVDQNQLWLRQRKIRDVPTPFLPGGGSGSEIYLSDVNFYLRLYEFGLFMSRY